jgi:hypothetical protein
MFNLNLTPPQAPPTWRHNPDQVTSLIDELIAKDKEVWDKIGSLGCDSKSVKDGGVWDNIDSLGCDSESVKDKEVWDNIDSLGYDSESIKDEEAWDNSDSSGCDFESVRLPQSVRSDHSTVLVFDYLIRSSLSCRVLLCRTSTHPSASNQLTISHAEAEMATAAEPLLFYQHVATSKELRNSAAAARKLLEEHKIKMSMRLDVYRAKVKAKRNILNSDRQLNPEEERLVEKLILEGKRDGLELPAKANRQKVERLQNDLSEAERKFDVSFVSDSLDGVVCSRARGTGKL